MLIRPSDDSPGLFVDLLRVDSVTPCRGPFDHYLVTFASGAVVAVPPHVGQPILEELAKKQGVSA